FSPRQHGRRRAPSRWETGPVVEQDQKGLAAVRSRERNHLDADLARIETHLAAGGHGSLACVCDGRKDLNEQFRANDPSQVEARWASSGLEIRPGLPAKLQDGEGLVHEHTRRSKPRQQETVRLSRQRVCRGTKRRGGGVRLKRQRGRAIRMLRDSAGPSVRHTPEHPRSAVDLLEQLRRMDDTLGGTKKQHALRTKRVMECSEDPALRDIVKKDQEIAEVDQVQWEKRGYGGTFLSA